MVEAHKRRAVEKKRKGIERDIENRSHLVGSVVKEEREDSIVVTVSATDTPPYKMKALLRDIHEDTAEKAIEQAWPNAPVDVNFHSDSGKVVYVVG